MKTHSSPTRSYLWSVGSCLLVLMSTSSARVSEEAEERSRIAAASLEDAVVVDCQLPGKLQKLGGIRTYMTPGTLKRLSAVDCRARGGEYTLGDLSSGTLSLQRWLPLAQQGQPEAQYYVARIYANGMSGVSTDYGKAAEWYQLAAKQNYSSAIQELGYLYEQGLGVQQDAKMALNLQRQAAGLGDELDYSWKITAAKEAAAQQIAALSAQLENSNDQLAALRGELDDTTHAVFKSRAQLAKSENALLDLREQLKIVKEGSGGQDTAKVKEIEATLVAREAALRTAQGQVETLSAQLREQQAQLASKLAASQASSTDLSELLATEQAKNRSLEARAAQADQRLLRSQQELAEQRAQYRAEVEQLLAERQDLERAVAQNKDGAAAIVAARERELAKQLLRVTSLEKELANAKQAQSVAVKASAAKAPAASAQAAADSVALNRVTDLQNRFDAQQKELKAQQQELASLRTKAQQDRAALVRETTEQLARRTAELEVKQQKLASLESETSELRTQVNFLRDQRDKDSNSLMSEAARAREATRVAQQKLNEQRERLDRLQTEKATEMASLAKARDQLQRQLAANQQANDMQIAFLKKDLEARQNDLESKNGEITKLEQRLDEQSKLFASMVAKTKTAPEPQRVAMNIDVQPKMRSADSRPASQGDAVASSLPDPMRASLSYFRSASPGKDYALVIGNSNYQNKNIVSLDTPINDARDVAALLQQRYGFDVQLLIDATRDQIMTALHQQKLKLGSADNLLIYYAGHGAVDDSAQRAFWLGVEANNDTRAGWLEADHIRAKIKEMSAKHVLLVADSCFSGAITHPKTTTIGRGLNETRLRVQWNRKARMVLTSGENTPVADSAGDKNHSLFARYFLQVLRQNVNIMSGEMLSHALGERMLTEPTKVGKDGRQQRPTYSTLQDADHDVGDFFFVPVAEPARVAGANW